MKLLCIYKKLVSAAGESDFIVAGAGAGAAAAVNAIVVVAVVVTFLLFFNYHKYIVSPLSFYMRAIHKGY